jgi:hypothetical protein
MLRRTWTLCGLAALGAMTLAAQFTMTVNKDRLINARNEPQNWLMMNGDYGQPATRNSLKSTART